MVVLRPDHAPRRIQTLRQKEEAIEAIGIESLLVIPFTRDFSLTEPEDFVRTLLARPARGLGALPRRALRVRPRQARATSPCSRGSAPSAASRPSAVEEVLVGGRAGLVHADPPGPRARRGRARRAAMLGRDYELDGLVVARRPGRATRSACRRSTSSPRTSCRPADGVYVTEIEIRSFGRRFESVTNIGRRPTLYEDYTTTIETYVLDFSSDVYGERVRLFFLDRLREERKFPSVMDLKAQIQRDIEATRAYFAKRGAPPG